MAKKSGYKRKRSPSPNQSTSDSPKVDQSVSKRIKTPGGGGTPVLSFYSQQDYDDRSFGSMTSPPHELYILTIPVLFHIILCCFRSNFGSSVLCPVYMYCVLYLAFLHVAIFFLFAVLPGFCLSVLAMYFVLSSTLQTPPFLLNWYQKTKFTSLRQYHFICTVL